MRLRRVNWERDPRLRNLTREEREVLHFIASSFKDEAAGDRESQFESDTGPISADVFYKCLKELDDESLVQAVLAMVSDILMENKSRVAYFYQNTDRENLQSKLLEEVFVIRNRRFTANHGQNQNQRTEPRTEPASDYTQAKAREVAALLLNIPGHAPERYERFWFWIVADIDQKAAEKGGRGLERGMLSLKLALYSEEFQQRFFATKDALNILWNVLKTQTETGGGKNRQVIYLTVFCLWILSFNPNSYHHLLHLGIMKTIINLLKSRLNPKIVRICLQFFVNLLGKPSFNEIFVNNNLVETLEKLRDEQYQSQDQEITQSGDMLLKGLDRDVKILSSFEKYAQEAESGTLGWGPVHTETFWKRNANKFEQDGYALLKHVVSLVRDSTHPETIAVACYDLGEFGRFYPEGRRIVETLDGKDYIMQRLQEDHSLKGYEQVRKHALLAIQKLLVANWEMIT